MPAYIIDAKRSAIGKYGGALSALSATEITAQVIKNILAANAKIKEKVDEVIIGNVLSAGLGQNPARITAFSAGLSNSTPAYTINKVCGSGLKSICLGSMMIECDQANLILAGGMENMSRAPHLLENYRFGSTKLGHHLIKDSMIHDGLHCSLINQHMAITAENLAKKFKITRLEQDNYALNSHSKTLSALDNKKFVDEIQPIKIQKRDSAVFFETDEQPRKNSNIDALTKLPAVFKKNGTITAGNASSLNDAAAMVLLASDKLVKKYRLKPLGVIRGYQSIAINPAFMGLGAYYAANQLLKKMNIRKDSIDLWEINEAFASQTLAVLKLLDIDISKVNVNGGAIALGHPIGASGARILVTLLYEMKRRRTRYGVASLCIGGGQGIAMLIENI